jgi:hypothetical protein
MNLQLIALTILVTSTSAMAIECTGLKSYNNGRRHVTITEQLKPITDVAGKMEVEIEDAYFIFTEKALNEYSAKIIMAPDYQIGVSTSANFDIEGNFSLAKINSSTRFVLNCKK